MVEIQQFENIKQKHGSYASWAVWADASEKPKSNMGDVTHFKNESVLRLLKNDVVMVGFLLIGFLLLGTFAGKLERVADQV